MTAAATATSFAARRTGSAILLEPQRHQRDDDLSRLGVRQEENAKEDGEVKQDGGSDVLAIGPLAEALLTRRTRPWLQGWWRAPHSTSRPMPRQAE
jgi:hypothetical protein